MPRNFPPKPDYSQPGLSAEKAVWEALQDLPDDAVVFAQTRVLDRYRITREADFVVAWPSVGLAIIEVKGGYVYSLNGEWFSQDTANRVHEIKDPMQQASRVGYALADFAVGQAIEWPQWTPLVVLPATPLPRWFTAPDSRPEQWIGTQHLRDLPDRLYAALHDDLTSEVFDGYSVEAVVRLLERDLPKPVGRDLAALGEAHADLITRDQYAILRALRTNNRIVVTGGPGTGKTWLAMEHARAETMRGARAAVLCFNRALATSLRAEAATWPPEQRPAFVGTFHRLALDWTGIAVPTPLLDGFWDGLAGRLADAAAARDEADRFDLVVVDEGQDYREAWWPVVASVLADPVDGPLVAFRDDEQALYGKQEMPWPATEVQLTENVRNTQQIAAALAALPGAAGSCRGLDGPPPKLEAAPADSVLEVADQVVAALVGSGDWRSGDIALLTTWGRHPEQIRLHEQLGPEGYSQLLAERNQLAVSTVMSFKGLERPVVVLAVNGFRDPDLAADVLRVGISRPTHRLIVVADPHQLRRAAGGQALLEVLRAAPQ